jgi:hypothetical protein
VGAVLKAHCWASFSRAWLLCSRSFCNDDCRIAKADHHWHSARHGFAVMVGEQAQEMQLAHWIPTTQIDRLANAIPPWMGMWFAVFPTVETLVAQLIAAVW